MKRRFSPTALRGEMQRTAELIAFLDAAEAKNRRKNMLDSVQHGSASR